MSLKKETKLKEILSQYKELAIAYSGGVDSTYLADVAHEVLGKHAYILIADSPSLPRSEFNEAVSIAESRHWNLTILQTKELSNDEYVKNDINRCYFCKSALFDEMKEFTRENKIRYISYGAIIDDLSDHRPGAEAAQYHNAFAPLQEAELSKADIRQRSKDRNLPTWDKPSMACLSSRIPTGTPVTRETLSQVERAEQILKDAGLWQYRVRHGETTCRIEIDASDFKILLDDTIRNTILERIKDCGYQKVLLDLTPYQRESKDVLEAVI